MAIAPLGSERGSEEARREGLRLIRGGRAAGAAPRGTARHAREAGSHLGEDDVRRRCRADHPTALGPEPSRRAAPDKRLEAASRRPPARLSARQHAAARAAAAARRRRVAGAAVVLVALALLAMPLRALGAVTVAGQPTPNGVPAGLAPGSVYVVQAGDTLASIAAKVNPADVGPIEHELAVATGSASVVPGEHVVIP